MPVEWGGNSKTCAQSAKPAPNDPPLIGANLGVVRALRSTVLALGVRNIDGSKRFGPCTHPHVEISSKLEVLGPRNGRGRTSSKLLKSAPGALDVRGVGGTLADLTLARRGPTLATLVRPRSEDLFLWSEDLFCETPPAVGL